MAFCLVPDFPAVLVALEHLKNLDKQLKEDRGVPFAGEASVHLTGISAAITVLETTRRDTRDLLHVEIIENSKLRYQIKNMSDRMSDDIMADIAAARASNADEIEQLHQDLKTISQHQEHAVKTLEELLNQNQILQPNQEDAKAEHEAVIATLNDEINLNYSLQMQLDQKLQQIEELKTSIAAVKQEKDSLLQNMTSQSKTSSEKRDSLSSQVREVMEKIKLLNKTITRCRQELVTVNENKKAALNHLEELNIHVAELESNLQRVRTSGSQREQQLEDEAKRNKELTQHRDVLKKEFHDSEEAFSLEVEDLHKQIASVESKIQERQTSGLHLKNTLSQVHELFKHRQGEENEVRAEYLRVSQLLDRSTLQLEERIAFIVQHSEMIKEMEKQIKELQEAEIIRKHVFEKDWEELSDNLETMKVNINWYEKEKIQLCQLLEETKRRQEEHVEKMRSDISNTKKRYEELLQEEAAFLQLQPMGTDSDILMSHMTKTETEHRQMESNHLQKVQHITSQTENICRSIEEKQEELEEKEETLKKVEANWSEEQNRHNKLSELIRELSRKKTELELSIQNTKTQTEELLQPKESMKAELEKLQETFTHMLSKQVSELRAMEVSIYNHGMILRQVRMENSQIHLRIRQMTEDIRTYMQEKEQYQQQELQLQHQTNDIRENLQEAWKDDVLVTQNCEKREKILLVSMNSLWNRLKTREEQLMAVSTLLHQKMLDFSKRLGDKATARRHELHTVTL